MVRKCRLEWRTSLQHSSMHNQYYRFGARFAHHEAPCLKFGVERNVQMILSGPRLSNATDSPIHYAREEDLYQDEFLIPFPILH